MSEESRSRRFERPSTSRGAIGGAIGGFAGALLFGGVLWLASPDVVSESIPAFYGFAESTGVGWALHLLHGTLLGIVFGIIATRRLIFDLVTGPVETDILKGLSANTRFGLLGIVFGIAIWTLLPFIGLSVLGAVEPFEDPGFPGVATDMILGHALFGAIVGLAFSMFVPARTPPLENATGVRE